MNTQFLYENGKDSVVNEYGRAEPMDYIVDEEQFRLETLSSHTQYLAQLPLENDKTVEAMQVEKEVKPGSDLVMGETSMKRNYTRYSDQDKVRFFKLLFEKCLSAAAAAKQLGIHVRTAQKWAEQYERDSDNIFKKRRQTGRPRILNKEHKKVILEYIDASPPHCILSLKKARFQPVDWNSKEKIQERLDWIHKWEKTDTDFMTNCVFLDESAFHINLKCSMAWSKKGSPAVVTVPKTRAKTTTILGSISAQGNGVEEVRGRRVELVKDDVY
ncbi:Homeodomain-like DNA binding domain-containing transcription factor [Phycomyces blakesleeanus NRRL 1555(-)]|uniref:Homeodomain-like DNA binding domain-containing transcription factor n=1 Tax=Phycomyces blakesleeanus (strain ATCC 8743b / DSM 1359 / FGSC 10004 / NBRC 33097 / NRRL 1555) TaxID=763407 RepID=A0A162Q8X2_PHYB8|nr:Homeodomain-like DNA binding domain-containing transcription factor [Phycomyces blakesleeanus NRRL 1555(-)]OAD81086.1 Homeodomain-like DNA binding domain-containing transcription factor [Phycomyces blakesleeanus NRRL 1555(-)]|eukprot:XP_018299126.1 Homeodomain-like DNA binding domain-containing transcription factor [Phycomyces blakesleeanus NRRL 1555(-)]